MSGGGDVELGGRVGSERGLLWSAGPLGRRVGGGLAMRSGAGWVVGRCFGFVSSLPGRAIESRLVPL